MDASDYYVLREEPCGECGGGGLVFRDDGGSSYCPCTYDGGGIGKMHVKVPLADALRALGIDVPEPEGAAAERCPP